MSECLTISDQLTRSTEDISALATEVQRRERKRQREKLASLYSLFTYSQIIYSSHIRGKIFPNGDCRRSRYRVEDPRETSDRLTESLPSRFETVNTIQSGMDCRERRLRMKVNINVVSPSLTLTRRQSSTCGVRS